MTREISKDAAIARIHQVGLTLAETINMADHELLAYSAIGRRTVRYIRSLEVLA